MVASWMGAAGFEAVYLSTAILILSTGLRRYAQRVALAAVITAIVLNAVADYAARVPGGLSSATAAWSSFDPLALLLSLVESAPLAGLSYAMATLLHRLAEQAEPEEDTRAAPSRRPALAAQSTNETEYAAVNTPLPGGNSSKSYVCRYCGAAGLTKSEQLAHGRTRKHSGSCGG
jgi:hypothetical protein